MGMGDERTRECWQKACLVVEQREEDWGTVLVMGVDFLVDVKDRKIFELGDCKNWGGGW